MMSHESASRKYEKKKRKQLRPLNWGVNLVVSFFLFVVSYNYCEADCESFEYDNEGARVVTTTARWSSWQNVPWQVLALDDESPCRFAPAKSGSRDAARASV